MTKEVKGKVVKTNSYESLKALYFSGKVKPTLNKIIAELESDAENLELILLACQCMLRTKDYDRLATYADMAIKIAASNANGYYYKGEALHHTKGKEQEALKNFNEALNLEPENVIFLQAKATTHLALFTDYHLPLKFAEKHRDKGEENLMKVVNIVEQKENPNFIEWATVGHVSLTINRKLDAKKFYIKAMNAFNAADEVDKDMNIYKEIAKGQKKVQ